MSEAALLRDIVFVFQNIEGEVIRYDSKKEAYKIDEKVRVECLDPQYLHTPNLLIMYMNVTGLSNYQTSLVAMLVYV